MFSTIDKTAFLLKVDEALNDIRPHLAIDGGDVKLLDVSDDGIVTIQWLGNCQGCAMSHMTLRAGIEQTIRTRIPEITSVRAVNN